MWKEASWVSPQNVFMENSIYTAVSDIQAVHIKTSYRIRKRIVLAAFMISIVIVCLFTLSRVRAESDAVLGAYMTGANLYAETIDSVNIVQNVKEKFDVMIFNSKSGGDKTNSVLVSAVSGAQDTFNQLANIVVTIASGLIMIYMVIYIIKESMRGDPTFDFWIKVFFMFALAFLFTTHWNVIMTKIADVGKAIVDQFNVEEMKIYNSKKLQYNAEALAGLEWMKTGNMISEMPEKIDDKFFNAYKNARENPNDMAAQQNLSTQIGNVTKNYITDNSWSKYLELSGLEDFIFKLAQFGLNIAIDGQILFIALQLLLRKLFAPIALADITVEGVRSPGVRFLKRYFALYLQCAIILMLSMVMLWMTKAIVLNSDVIGAFNMRIVVLMICLTTFTASITQSGNLANELVGD